MCEYTFAGEDLTFVLEIEILQKVLYLKIAHLILDDVSKPDLVCRCLAALDAIGHKFDRFYLKRLMEDLHCQHIRHLYWHLYIGEQRLFLLVQMKVLLVRPLLVLQYP